MATIAQSISMNAHGGQARVGEGNKTQAIYTLISEQKYQEGACTLPVHATRSKRRCAAAASDANGMRLLLLRARSAPSHQRGCCWLSQPRVLTSSIRCVLSAFLLLPVVQPSKC